MTVGFYSPIPPARTGVADYSHALLPHLQRHCKIRLNQDGDVNLYHTGNNQLHAEIYKRALQKPGIVVLHDAVLHHFALGFFSRNEYISEFTYNYGEWTRNVAERMWSERGRSAVDPGYFRYAFLKRLAERSQTVVVHNPAAARIVREHHPGARIVEIPHLVIPSHVPPPGVIEDVRRGLGSGLIFGIFGHLRESKRILPLLRIFARRPAITLLLAGEIASSDLRRACEPYLRLENIRRIGYMKPTDYWAAAHAVDACINLRYPAAGETSGVSVGMMGAGTAVIMTDSEENSHYPISTCMKISAGLSEEAELEAVLDWLQQHPLALSRIGACGAAYVRSQHAGEKVGEAYARTFALD